MILATRLVIYATDSKILRRKIILDDESQLELHQPGPGESQLLLPLSAPFDDATCREKTRHLLDAFASQRDRRWFTEDTFRGLMRVRGVECAAPGGYAEAFYAHKLVVRPRPCEGR